MKRKFGLSIAFICLAASLTAFAACTYITSGGMNGDSGYSGESSASDKVDFTVSAVFIASSDVMELTAETSVKDYLDALQSAGEIAFEGYDGSYGYYITSVNGIEESTTYGEGYSFGYCWMLYTDFTEADGVTYADSSYGTFDYNGRELACASYGVSYLPCVEGYSYALVYEAWSYTS